MRRFAALGLVLIVVLGGSCSTQPHAPKTTSAVIPSSGSGVVVGKALMDGNPLPGATVTLIASDGATRVATTDANGFYRFVLVPAASYTVRFELAGFQNVNRQVNVAGSGESVATAEMRIGAVAESITVMAEAPQGVASGSFTVSAPSSSGPRPQRAKVVAQTTASAPQPMYIADAVQETRQDTEYAPISEHEFIDVARQSTTTFAIDVDRASYANVRRYLTANSKPPAEAVRIEEMINYFTYDYPQPKDEHPFSITADAAGCPWNPAHRIARIGIQGRNLDEWKMAPNNLVFLLDVSGSMQPPERLPLIKSSFRHLVDRLRAQDSVAIVVYAGAAGLVLPPTSGADKRAILGALDNLNAGGSTAGAAGIELAYKVAHENFRKDGNNRVILATDGDFNVGVSSIDELQTMIEEKRKLGVFLSVIGVGGSFNDELMETLADKGNGNYSYLDTPREAEKVFKQELTGTLVTIAKDVKVQIDFDSRYVASYRQIGYENRALANKDFDDDTKDAGDLGAGHSVTALYEIVPAPGAPTRGTIAGVKLRYKDPDGEQSKLLTASIVDQGRSAYEAPADMQFALAIAQFGMLLRDSPHKGTSTYADALALARAARGVDLEGFREEMIRLLDASRAISGEAAPAIATH